MIRVTVWNEFRHEKSSKEVAAIYPNGLHATIAEFLGKNEDIECRLACLDDPEHGLTDDVLDNTDVLIWWGHMAHDQVSDAVVDKVQDHVLRGMGLIVLHSGHFSKIFRRLMGTSCSLKWRDGARERLWCANPGHPVLHLLITIILIFPEDQKIPLILRILRIAKRKVCCLRPIMKR